MPLSKKAIDELKAIYKECYGEDLSDEDAWEMGHRLLRVFYVLTQPIDRLDVAKKFEPSGV